jgi:hypothetical protein
MYLPNYSWFLKEVFYAVELINISLTECSSGIIQKLPFGVDTRIEPKNVTATSAIFGIFDTWNIPRWMAVSSDVAVTCLR